MLEIALIIIGLIIFEVVISIDNAIINAYIIKGMSEKWRRRFLTWGILIAVFLIRFFIPLLLIAFTLQNLNLLEVLNEDIKSPKSIKANESLLLMFGGVFLIYVYLHWLFMEDKRPLFLERFVKKSYSIWFFAICAIVLTIILYFSRFNVWLMLVSSLASSVFFILFGFRKMAAENISKNKDVKDFSSFLYLELLDASFSFDSIFGALAFTRNLILILIGIGSGAIIVRQLTIKGLKIITKFKYLKNGAMTSIGFLGLYMILKSLGFDLPDYLPALITFLFVGISYYYDTKKRKQEHRI